MSEFDTINSCHKFKTPLIQCLVPPYYSLMDYAHNIIEIVYDRGQVEFIYNWLNYWQLCSQVPSNKGKFALIIGL